jgi:hypothetical protein
MVTKENKPGVAVGFALMFFFVTLFARSNQFSQFL